jgi:hypothetical protein
MFRSLKTLLAATALCVLAGLILPSSWHAADGGSNGGGYGGQFTRAITFITHLVHADGPLADGEPGTGNSGGYGGKKVLPMANIAFAGDNTPGSGNSGGYGGK